MCPVTLTTAATATAAAIASAASATAAAAASVGSVIGAGISTAGSFMGGLAASGASALGAGAGTAAATGTVVSGITEGAIVGGALGTATGAGGAAITGGDIGKGALTGLWTGAASGAALGGLGSVSQAAKAADIANGLAKPMQAPGELMTVTDPEMASQLGVEVGSTVAVPGETVASTISTADAAKTGMSQAARIGGVSGADTGGAAGIDWKAAGVAGMQIAGGGVQAYGAYEDGKQTAANLKAQAKGLENERRAKLEAASIEAKDIARRQRQLIGKGKVAAAANGVMLEGRAESSPAMWEQDAAAELAWDQEKLFHSANAQADILAEQAGQNRKMARNARKTGNLRAATSLLTSAANAGVGYYGMTSRYA